MSQYTSTQIISQLDGNAVNATLDTETNQVTFTVTLPTGNIITVTGNNDNSVFNQLESQGISSTSTAYLLAARAVRNVRAQAAAATAVATATGEPPPAENQAIPTNNTVDPAVPATAATPENEQIENESPQSTAEDQPAAAEEEPYVPLQEPPGAQDEFSGIDTQIEANENALQEPTDITPEEDPWEAMRQERENEFNDTPIVIADDVIKSSYRGITAASTNTRAQATAQDQAQFTKQEDWRVRLSLSPGATYLYKAKNPGILKPLADTNGVIFPYTPSVQVGYAANYDSTDLVHSNYKIFQYKNSSVDNIQISCDFTAQDTSEANYLLAVIHFFRSVTKMFYGQDNGPKPGTPPPLCFLTGLGAFQFNEHPLAIVSFNYNLPTDVDYIRAGQITSLAGVNQQSMLRPVNAYDVSSIRLGSIKPGGAPADPVWGSMTPAQANVTYVPTKMQIQISAIPMPSRNDISNNFSLTDYASGKLLRGLQNVRGGFW